MKLTSVALIGAAALLATSASAADLGKGAPSANDVLAAPSSGKAINWNAIWIGVQGGYGNSNHNVSGDEIEHISATCDGLPTTGTASDCGGGKFVAAQDVSVASAFVDGFNSHGLFGGLSAGADIQRGNLLFGVFGDYNISNADASVGAHEGVCPDCFQANGSIEDGNSWLVAGRAGYLFGQEKRALLYVLGGYGQQDVSYHGDASVGGTLIGDPFNKDVTFSGFVAGAGGEYALTNALSLGIEYQHFFGGEQTIFDGRGAEGNGLVVKDDMDSDKVMARLKLKLSAGLFGY